MPIDPEPRYYRSADPRDNIRIRVLGWSPFGAGHYGAGTAQIVTVLPDGTEVRQRSISLRQLHDSPLTKTGQPRRTGYVLETTNPSATED